MLATKALAADWELKIAGGVRIWIITVSYHRMTQLSTISGSKDCSATRMYDNLADSF